MEQLINECKTKIVESSLGLDESAEQIAAFAIRAYTGKLLKKALRIVEAIADFNAELIDPK